MNVLVFNLASDHAGKVAVGTAACPSFRLPAADWL